MEAFVQRILSDYLSVFVVGFQPEQLGFKMTLVSGQSSELRDLNFDCSRLNALMGATNIRLSRFHINFMKVELSITRLKSKPICITLDKVTMEWEEVEAETAAVEVAKYEQLVAEVIRTFPAKERKPSAYGQLQHALDGVSISVNHIVVKASFLGSSSVDATALVFDIRGLQIDNCNSLWQKTELIDFRKQNGVVQIFKLCTCSSLYAWLQPTSNSHAQHCHLLDGSPFTIQVGLARSSKTSELLDLSIDVVLPEFHATLNQDQCQVLVNFILDVGRCLLRMKGDLPRDGELSELPSFMSNITITSSPPPSPPTSPPPTTPPISPRTFQSGPKKVESQGQEVLKFTPNISICFQVDRSVISLLYPQGFCSKAETTEEGATSDGTMGMKRDQKLPPASIGIEIELLHFSFTKLLRLSSRESTDQIAFHRFRLKSLGENAALNLNLLSFERQPGTASTKPTLTLVPAIEPLILPFDYRSQVHAAHAAEVEQHAVRISIFKSPEAQQVDSCASRSQIDVFLEQVLCELDTAECFRILEFLDKTMDSELFGFSTNDQNSVSSAYSEGYQSEDDETNSGSVRLSMNPQLRIHVRQVELILPCLDAFSSPKFQFTLTGITIAELSHKFGNQHACDGNSYEESFVQDFTFELGDMSLKMLPWGSFAQEQHLLGPIHLSGMVSIPQSRINVSEFEMVVNVIADAIVLRYHYLFFLKLQSSLENHLILFRKYAKRFVKRSTRKLSEVFESTRIQIVLQAQLVTVQLFAHDGDLPDMNAESLTPRNVSPSRRKSSIAYPLFETQCSNIVLEFSNSIRTQQAFQHQGKPLTSETDTIDCLPPVSTDISSHTGNDEECERTVRFQLRVGTIALLSRDPVDATPYIVLSVHPQQDRTESSARIPVQSMLRMEVELVYLLEESKQVKGEVDLYDIYLDIRPELLQRGVSHVVNLDRFTSRMTMSERMGDINQVKLQLKQQCSRLVLRMRNVAMTFAHENTDFDLKGIRCDVMRLEASYTSDHVEVNEVSQVLLEVEQMGLRLENKSPQVLNMVQVVDPFQLSASWRKVSPGDDGWRIETSTTASPVSVALTLESFQYLKSVLQFILRRSNRELIAQPFSPVQNKSKNSLAANQQLFDKAIETLPRDLYEQDSLDTAKTKADLHSTITEVRQLVQELESKCPTIMSAFKHSEEQWTLYLSSWMHQAKQADNGRLSALSKAKVDCAGWMWLKTPGYGKQKRFWVVLNFAKLFFFIEPNDTDAQLVLDVHKYQIQERNPKAQGMKVGHGLLLSLLDAKEGTNSVSAALARNLSKSRLNSLVLVLESAEEKANWFNALSLLASVMKPSENPPERLQIDTGDAFLSTDSVSPVKRSALKFRQNAFNVAAKARLLTGKLKQELSEKAEQLIDKSTLPTTSRSPRNIVDTMQGGQSHEIRKPHGQSNDQIHVLESQSFSTLDSDGSEETDEKKGCTTCTFLNRMDAGACEMCGAKMSMTNNSSEHPTAIETGLPSALAFDEADFESATQILKKCNQITEAHLEHLDDLVIKLREKCSGAYWMSNITALHLEELEEAWSIDKHASQVKILLLQEKESSWHERFDVLARQNSVLNEKLDKATNEVQLATHQLDKAIDRVRTLEREVETANNVAHMKAQLDALKGDSKRLQEIANTYMELFFKSEETVKSLEKKLKENDSGQRPTAVTKCKEDLQSVKEDKQSFQLECENIRLKSEIQQLQLQLSKEQTHHRSTQKLLKAYRRTITVGVGQEQGYKNSILLGSEDAMNRLQDTLAELKLEYEGAQ